MSLMLHGFREGSWYIRSESDPRWDCDGYGIVGGFCMPPDASDAVEKLKKKLKEEPPDDLEYEYWKD